jgi:hypothetical protein
MVRALIVACGTDVLAYEGGRFLKDPGVKVHRAWTALDPDRTRIITYRYGKENIQDLVAAVKELRRTTGGGGDRNAKAV